MEQSVNIPIFNISGTSFGNIPRNFIGNFFPNILGIYYENISRIFHEQCSWNIIWEYSPDFHRELFPNILGIYHGNVLRIFHKHIFVLWDLSKESVAGSTFLNGRTNNLLIFLNVGESDNLNYCILAALLFHIYIYSKIMFF